MSKIIFFGDSGIKDSALHAYRTAYCQTFDETYEAIKTQALHIIENNYQVPLNQLKLRYLNQLFNHSNTTIQEQLKQSIKIENFYYEKSHTPQIRSFRCFVSSSIDENQLQALSGKLARHQYQFLHLALTDGIKEQA